MGVFLDTSFILALKNKDEKHHSTAKMLMERFLKKELGKIFTSTFVFDELATLIIIRLGNLEYAKKVCNYLLASPRINIVGLGHKDFIVSWEKFQNYGEKGLSFTDCSILAQCLSLDCDLVASFDHHFKGIIGIIS